MGCSGCGCGVTTDSNAIDSIGSISKEIRDLATDITWRDVLGAWRVRWGIRRLDYRVEPGLCRIGQAESSSQ